MSEKEDLIVFGFNGTNPQYPKTTVDPKGLYGTVIKDPTPEEKAKLEEEYKKFWKEHDKNNEDN